MSAYNFVSESVIIVKSWKMKVSECNFVSESVIIAKSLAKLDGTKQGCAVLSQARGVQRRTRLDSARLCCAILSRASPSHGHGSRGTRLGSQDSSRQTNGGKALARFY